jgi:carbohydrate kinase (thermoresistant glucokinase family)
VPEPGTVIAIVAGVSGSGKSTVGALVAGQLGWPFTDGDSLHPEANIAKMASGVALTDEDRMPWLRAIGAWMDGQIRLHEPGLVACSALKRTYRDQLLAERPSARMAFLLIGQEAAARRLAARHGHFFDPALLDSQFADLEPPGPDEASVVTVAVSGRPEETADAVLRTLGITGHGRPAWTDQPGR